MVNNTSPDGSDAHLEATGFGGDRIYQAGANQYIETHWHFDSNARRTPPAQSGAVVEVCPYPTGMAAFHTEDAAWFFGRDRVLANLTERLDERLQHGGAPLLVGAPSGAGKTSLLQAGLVPKLARGALPGSQNWPCLRMTPTGHPITALATAIAPLIGASVEDVTRQLTDYSDRCLDSLRGLLRTRTGNATNTGARLVLIVDQLEELFTMCTDLRERQHFLTLISLLTDKGPGQRAPIALVVFGLRADFYSHCANYPQLARALEEGHIVLGPMSPGELREVIVYPAQRAGLRIEPGLVDILLRDLGSTTAYDPAEVVVGSYEAGRLPLLAHALRATWRERHGHTLTTEGYRLTGGIQNAVAKTAERTFAELNPAEQHASRALFLQLVRIGRDGTEDARRRVPRAALLGDDAEYDAALKTVLTMFTENRLLTQGRNSVEITHEALLHAWPRFREWINEDRAGNLLRQELSEAAIAWDRAGRDTAMLYRGLRLRAARDWRSSQPRQQALTPTAKAFLDASIRHDRRAAGRRRAIFAALASLTAISLISTGIVVRQQIRVASERDLAVFHEITARADQLFDNTSSRDQSQAAQLYLAAHRMQPDDQSTNTQLINTENTPLSATLETPGSTVSSVALSPDGKILASGGSDKVGRLWDITNPIKQKLLGTFETSNGHSIYSLAFSSDGKTLASGDGGGGVELWNVTNRDDPGLLETLRPGAGGATFSVAFSIDGKVAAGSGNGVEQLWDVTQPGQSESLYSWRARDLCAVDNGGCYIYSMAFSSDGRTLADGSSDKTVKLWNIDDPRNPAPLGKPLTGHSRTVNSVAFSRADSTTLVSGSDDGTARLWNLTDPATPTTIVTANAPVKSVALSSDGKTLASGNSDGTAQLWNITNRAHPKPIGRSLAGHTAQVNSVAFTLEGNVLATGSGDQTVRLWNIPDTLLTDHTGSVNSLALSGDGKVLASGSGDGTVRLWNLSNPNHPTAWGEAIKATAFVNSVALSLDGETLATGARDGTVQLWDIGHRTHFEKIGRPLAEYDKQVNSVAFSPDGKMLAAGSDDNFLNLWNVANPYRPTELGERNGAGDSVNSVAFCFDSKMIAVGWTDATVQLFDVTTTLAEKSKRQKSLQEGSVNSVALSRNCETLASGGNDGTVQLWHIRDRTNMEMIGNPLTAAARSVNSVAFSRDGGTLVTGNGDRTVKRWDIEDLTSPALLGRSLTGPTGPVASVVLSPDGRTLAAGSEDHAIRLWDLDPNQAIQRICETSRPPLPSYTGC